MKVLRAGCFMVGLISLTRIVLMYIHTAGISREHIQEAGSQLQLQTDPLPIVITMAISAASALICIFLSGKLNRSKAGWGIFGFFLPYIACFILPFLKMTDPASKGTSWWNTTGGTGTSSGNTRGGYSFYGEKTCGRCGRVVPSSSRPGQNCPHCGAYWGTESGKIKH
jgi:hypothetical protein